MRKIQKYYFTAFCDHGGSCDKSDTGGEGGETGGSTGGENSDKNSADILGDFSECDILF